MRTFEKLDTFSREDSTGILHVTSRRPNDLQPRLALRREGDYVAISASYGPLEIALRPRYGDLTWTLSHLQSVEGLQTSRHVGTGQAYLALGLKPDGGLLLRPTILGDATGHFSFNFELTGEVTQSLLAALDVKR
jgi:hypothetical protein